MPWAERIGALVVTHEDRSGLRVRKFEDTREGAKCEDVGIADRDGRFRRKQGNVEQFQRERVTTPEFTTEGMARQLRVDHRVCCPTVDERQRVPDHLVEALAVLSSQRPIVMKD